MNLTLLKTIFLLSKLIAFNVGRELKKCSGDDISGLPFDCQVIESKPLTIDKDTDREFLLEINEDQRNSNLFKVREAENKLKSVIRIEYGLSVSETEIDRLSCLPEVQEIQNPEGYAMTFNKNQNLSRIIMPKLKILKGKTGGAYFYDDNILREAFEKENLESIADLLFLKEVTHYSDGQNNCIAAAPFSKKSYICFHLELILIITTIISAIIGCYCIYKVCGRRRNGKKKRSVEKKDEEHKKANQGNAEGQPRWSETAAKQVSVNKNVKNRGKSHGKLNIPVKEKTKPK